MKKLNAVRPHQTIPQAKVIAINAYKTEKECGENIDKEPLTIENLRACEGYENISELEANTIIESLKTFAEIVISTYLKNNILIDNQQVIYLNSQKQEAA